MIGTVIANVLRFLLLVLVQVLVLDHIDLANGWAVPYLYVLFLLMLPLELPDWAGLLIGAFTGFVLDVFSSTPGMHMSACTVMMFARIHLLKIISPREGYEFGVRPNIPDMGMAWFLTYAGLLVLAHHLWLFMIELHSFRAVPATALRALISAAFTLLLCLLAQFLTSTSVQARK